MFKEASVYTLKSLTEEQRAASGLLVLAMWRWPRGIPRTQVDLWIPSAAPLPELLAAHRAGHIPWEDFATVYCVCQVMAHQCTVITCQGIVALREQNYLHSSLDH